MLFDNDSKFECGQIVVTRVVNDNLLTGVLPHRELSVALHRHFSGDWGEVSKGDAKANEDALKSGARILSAYTIADVRYWIITDAEYTEDDEDAPRRHATTILLPEEY